MADCAACGAKIDEGVTRCPQCRANLQRPGSLLQIGGWVLFFMSSIPIVVGVDTAEQRAYAPLAVGIALLVAGVCMILVGRARTAASPETVRPSSPSGAAST
jgi:hypothetical protein